jgi:hypothetical protein
MIMDPNQTLGLREGLRQPLEGARDALLEAGKQARQVIGEVGQTVDPLRTSLEEAISAYPLKAVMGAFAAGVVMGWLIKRT